MVIPEKTIKISKTPEKTNRWVTDVHMKDSIKTIAKFDNMIAP